MATLDEIGQEKQRISERLARRRRRARLAGKYHDAGIGRTKTAFRPSLVSLHSLLLRAKAVRRERRSQLPGSRL